ncbi:TonB-dependent receptor [Paraglaciecola arctica]|uniref:TonB-dependent receptor n=1 Tax=Paraglaciecola arctica TaxID=1128911 RepID=UPI001C075BC2|nr:TonB-dependent receptor [Paraglaciecola arctica]MBU3004635.1 TonB-dependent receptor [Paraglaciecola arctica]
MKTPIHRLNTISRSVIVALVACSAQLALAQETVSTNTGSVDEDKEDIETILVTANKRLQSLKDTPIAVTVTNQQTIEQSKVLDIKDLQAVVPSLRVSQLNFAANTNFSIRGFGNGSNNVGIEPSVGVFIDGVYRSRAGSQISDLPKLERVEVLRGPQSTLFGKNASAGVISIITGKPSFDPEAKVELAVGNYNQRLINGYYSAGLSDTVAVAVSGGVNKRDGYTDSLSGLSAVNDKDRWNVRAQAIYEPSDDLRFRFIADYNEIDEICCTTTNIVNGPTSLIIQALGGQTLDDQTPFSYESALNQDSLTKIEDGGLSLQVDKEFDGFSLTSISAYRVSDLETSSDDDHTSLDIILGSGIFGTETFTQEIRLTSDNSDKFEWMLGAFYFDEEVTRTGDLIFGEFLRPYFDTQIAAVLGAAGVVIPGGLLGTVEALTGNAPGSFFGPNTYITTDYIQDNQAYSLFATFDYHISENLTATVGLNYTDDEKDLQITQLLNDDVMSSFDAATVNGGIINTVLPGTVPLIQAFQFVPPFLDFPNSVESGRSSDSDTTWTARLAYKLNDSWNIYGSAATGFKATSWNLSRDSRPFATDQAALEAAGLTQVNQNYGTRYAGPEQSKVYELGIKGGFKEGSLNIALFDQTIEGFQSSIFVGTGFVLANAGKQSTTGLEVEGSYFATDDLTLSFAGTFLDPKFDSFVGGLGVDGPEDLSGSKPAGVHEQSVNVSATYYFEPMSDILGYMRVGYLWESPTRIANNVPESIEREVSTFNASLGLEMENGLTIQVWARNLTNDEYFVGAYPALIQGGTFSGYPSQPRTFGISFSYAWAE